MIQTAPRPHLTSYQCAKRYPRLTRCMKWVAILSDGEAGCALRDYRDGMQGPGWGGEAVCHFGGPRKVIERAWASRHVVLTPSSHPGIGRVTVERPSDGRVVTVYQA